MEVDAQGKIFDIKIWMGSLREDRTCSAHQRGKRGRDIRAHYFGGASKGGGPPSQFSPPADVKEDPVVQKAADQDEASASSSQASARGDGPEESKPAPEQSAGSTGSLVPESVSTSPAEPNPPPPPRAAEEARSHHRVQSAGSRVEYLTSGTPRMDCPNHLKSNQQEQRRKAAPKKDKARNSTPDVVLRAAKTSAISPFGSTG